MDFIEKLQQISNRLSSNMAHIQTEEGTKNAVIMPMISALGYDIFDPTEVIPEYTTDVGIKKGEKVDYAIAKDGKMIILVECKSVSTDLDKIVASQLYRYFSVSEARFSVLTNGIEYRFFSDVDAPNIMDSKPFFTFNLLTFDENSSNELKKFSKLSFDLENIISTASELKYSNAIKKYLSDQLISPNDDFVRFYAAQVYSGKLTQKVIEYFRKIVKDAIGQFIRERVNDRLKSALTVDEVEVEKSEILTNGDDEDSRHIVTTSEEFEAYNIVRAIVREIVDVKRVAIRDKKSYCGILLDDNNRKPICRLHFNAVQKYIGLFNNKDEEKVTITEIDDIFKFADRIKDSIIQYENKAVEKP